MPASMLKLQGSIWNHTGKVAVSSRLVSGIWKDRSMQQYSPKQSSVRLHWTNGFKTSGIIFSTWRKSGQSETVIYTNESNSHWPFKTKSTSFTFTERNHAIVRITTKKLVLSLKGKIYFVFQRMLAYCLGSLVRYMLLHVWFRQFLIASEAGQTPGD